MMRPAGPRHSPPDSLRRAKRPPALLGRRAPHAEAGQRVSRETSAAPPSRPRPGRPAARMAVAGSSLSSPPPTPCSRGATCQEGVLTPAPARRVLHARHRAPSAPRRLPSGRGFARPASGRGPAPPVGRPLALARMRMFHVKHAPAPRPVASPQAGASPPPPRRVFPPPIPPASPAPAPRIHCRLPQKWPKTLRFTPLGGRIAASRQSRPGETRSLPRRQDANQRKPQCFWPETPIARACSGAAGAVRGCALERVSIWQR